MAGSEAAKAGTGHITLHVSPHTACNAAHLELGARLAICIAAQCSAVQCSSAVAHAKPSTTFAHHTPAAAAI